VPVIHDSDRGHDATDEIDRAPRWAASFIAGVLEVVRSRISCSWHPISACQFSGHSRFLVGTPTPPGHPQSSAIRCLPSRPLLGQRQSAQGSACEDYLGAGGPAMGGILGPWLRSASSFVTNQ
jgi:hypothetical protein